MHGSASLCGLWRRTLFARPGAPDDLTSHVVWLQAPLYFVDLRQPADLPLFADVSCISDLEDRHMRDLARQEGFAGQLHYDGAIAHWRRQIDFQPDTGVPDRAAAQLHENLLIEHGLHATYTEHWERTASAAPCFGLKLQDDCSQAAYIVRSGAHLMYARPRAEIVTGQNLQAAIAAAPDLDARRAIVDFEISLGRINANEFSIEHSTLPFKANKTFEIRAEEYALKIADIDKRGGVFWRQFRLTAIDADAPAHAWFL